jgi:hypothetical protein
MTISTIGAVTNLLEQHSFAFRAVSCVEITNHIFEFQIPSIRKES